MRIPKTPPDIADLFKTVGRDQRKLLEVIQSVSSGTGGDYYHWDDLLYRTPPIGLTHEEWWLGLKMARISAANMLPSMLDKKESAFSFNLTDPIPERLHEIDLIAGGRGETPSMAGSRGESPPQGTTSEIRDQDLIGAQIEEAITSSQLESATATKRVARQLIRSGRKPRGRSETMIFNNYLTMKMIVELKTEELTPDLVLHIHEYVTRNTLDDPTASGRIRNSLEDIYVADREDQVVHRPPHADTLQARMESMCAFANGASEGPFIHPVLRSIILHFWLGYDHPFVDGNGRCARALFYWSMLHHGYWLSEYISISRILLKAPVQYGMSFLYTETDGNDLTYFLLHNLGVIRRSIDALHRFIRKRTEQLKQLESLAQDLDAFNHRQRDLLSHAMRHPGHPYTIKAHQTLHDVVYETARTDLLELQERGLFLLEKQGRKWVFTAPEDLEARLGEERD